MRKERIAVIGSGAAGVVSAYLLQRKYDVTVFEKNDYIGGHTHTIEIEDGPDAGTGVDVGFIVFNDKTYPLFRKFLAELNVAYGESDMSFSYFNPETGVQYAGSDFRGLFAGRGSLLSLSHWRFLLGILSFCRKAGVELEANRLSGLTLGEFCDRARFSPAVVERYVLPMASAIWSSPMLKIRDFPMESFASFYRNHGLLSLRNRPTWYYVKGGSQTYVKRFLEGFVGRVERGNGAVSVSRRDSEVTVVLESGETRAFDRVVIAAHADEAIAMLTDASPEEKRLLGAWRYSDNRVILHTDESVMPPSRHAWASWNYCHYKGAGLDAPATLTYHMNRLQRLDTRKQYFVTLNSHDQIREEHIVKELRCMHPTYDFDALDSQAGLDSLNRNSRTCFCGSYFRHGFHEDAVRSAVSVAGHLGVEF